MSPKNKNKSEIQALREDLEMYNSSIGESLLQITKSIKFLGREFYRFKDEMLGFKDEMLGFKQEMLGFKNEMLGFKQEMLEFKNKTESFRSETIGCFADVMGELQTIREELTILPHQVSRNAKRLDVVESHLGIITP